MHDRVHPDRELVVFQRIKVTVAMRLVNIRLWGLAPSLLLFFAPPENFFHGE